MKILKFVLLFAFVFGVAGCISDEANRRYVYDLPAKKAKEVEILRVVPARKYVVVADFQAINASANHMRKRAAQVGADAVIVVPVGGNYSQSEVWASEDRFANSYQRMLGTAIKYED